MRTQLDPEQQFVGHTNIYVAEVVSDFDIGLIKSVVQCEQKRYNSMARRNVVVIPIEGTRPKTRVRYTCSPFIMFVDFGVIYSV